MIELQLGAIVMNETFQYRLNLAMKNNNIKAARLSEITGIPPSGISQYRSGKAKASQEKLILLSKALNTSPVWLMGYDVPDASVNETVKVDNLYHISEKKYPLIGAIACGTPIFAEENIEDYITANMDDINADFCLRARGDSMEGAQIYDNNIVFIRKQPVVSNGEIAAVLIDDTATLKRFYHSNGIVTLNAENPKYAPLVYKEQELETVRVIGRAVAILKKI